MAEIKFHYLNALPQNPNSKELYFIKNASNGKGRLYRGSQLIAETSAAEIESLANDVAAALGAIQEGYETKADALAKLGEAEGYAENAKTAAIEYTNGMISAIVGEGAVETLDTIGEISQAIEENQEILDILDEAIRKKANQTDLTSHINNNGIHLTEDEKNILESELVSVSSYTSLPLYSISISRYSTMTNHSTTALAGSLYSNVISMGGLAITNISIFMGGVAVDYAYTQLDNHSFEIKNLEVTGDIEIIVRAVAAEPT